MRPDRLLIAFLATVIFLFAASDVSAHRPEEGQAEGITIIPNPTTSFAYYEQLTTADQVDVYAVAVEAGQFFHAGINIPQIDRLADFGVTMALVGPGLPALEAGDLPALPANLRPDDHDQTREPGKALARVDRASGREEAWLAALDVNTLNGFVVASERSRDFYEPFTQTNYWGRQTLELDLPQSATYYLLIWQPAGQTGKYVLDTGAEEVFGPGDLFRFPLWWLDTHVYFEHTPYLIGGGTLLLSLAAGLFWLIMLARRRPAAVSASMPPAGRSTL